MAVPLIPLVLSLARFAPSITRWLSGDEPGPVAQAVGAIAQTVTGAGSVEEAVARLEQAPEQQRAFQLAVMEKADSLERAYLADRQSARVRDEKIQLARGKNRRGDVLAGLAIVGLIVTIGLLFAGAVPADNREMVMLLIGALIGLVKDVYGFEFGSSKEASRGMNVVADAMQRNGKH